MTRCVINYKYVPRTEKVGDAFGVSIDRCVEIEESLSEMKQDADTTKSDMIRYVLENYKDGELVMALWIAGAVTSSPF